MKRWAMALLYLGLFLISSACGQATVPEGTDINLSDQPTAAPPSGYPAYPAPSAGGYPASSPSDRQEPAAPAVSEVRFAGKLAFHSTRAGDGLQVFVMDGRNGSIEQVTSGVAQGYEPAWSPDCQTLLYTLQRASNDIDVHQIELEGGESRPLLQADRSSTLEWSATWSPKFDRIAYQTNPGAMLNVCFTDEAGLDHGCLDSAGSNAGHPSYSADGEELLYIGNPEGDWEIYRRAASGVGAPVQLTENNFVDKHPRYSPDGEHIVFEANPAGTFDIFVMRWDGSEAVALTTTLQDEKDPEWLGNDRIIFASEVAGNWDLYVINRDGTDLKRLTDHGAEDSGPAWCAP